jgi:lysophospholipase L1-like esterase
MSVRPAAAAASVSYAALGDSYSSGLGAGDYLFSGGNCGRSRQAYPEQWARSVSPASFVFAACAGATTADVINSQVPALRRSTTLVSITIGGNDAGFASVMQTCALSPASTCLQAAAAAEAFVTRHLPARLTAVLRAIHAHAPGARIVLLGYPELYDLSKSATCIGLSTRGRVALNAAADALDRALEAAAAAGHAIWADTRGQFARHKICGPDSWLHAVDLFALSSSYHPTASGQGLGYLPVFARFAAEPSPRPVQKQRE